MTLWRTRSNVAPAGPNETTPVAPRESAPPAQPEPTNVRSVALDPGGYRSCDGAELRTGDDHSDRPRSAHLLRAGSRRDPSRSAAHPARSRGGPRPAGDRGRKRQADLRAERSGGNHRSAVARCGAPGPADARAAAGRSTQTTIEQVQQAATEIEKAADAAASAPPAPSGVTRVQVEEPPVNVSGLIVTSSLTVVMAFVQALLILFFAYFLLTSGDLFKRKLVKIVGPSLTQKKITVQILDDIDRQIARFLLVQVVTSAVVGIATWLALRSINLGQAAVWGLLAGIFNSIPYLGPVIVTATIAAVAFLQFGTLKMMGVAGGMAFAITTLEGFGLTPWLAGRAARMNAVAVFVGLVFWGWVWGVWGMLLAVPMMSVLKAVCDHVEDFKGVGELLGE